MKSLVKTFRLLELTRAQPQYGYVLAEIPKGEISDLAQHHYLVSAFAWQLARAINKQGGSLSIERILEIALVHDLGELFGGDIAMPYALANPVAKEKASAFEKENHRFLAQFLDEDEAYLTALFAEAMEPKTDEAFIAKMADYLEVSHYKLYVGKMTANDITMVTKRMKKFCESLSNPLHRKVTQQILKEWETEMLKPMSELFESHK